MEPKHTQFGVSHETPNCVNIRFTETVFKAAAFIDFAVKTLNYHFV